MLKFHHPIDQTTALEENLLIRFEKWFVIIFDSYYHKQVFQSEMKLL